MRHIFFTFNTLEGAPGRTILDFLHISKYLLFFIWDFLLDFCGKIFLKWVDSSAIMDNSYYYTWHLVCQNR